MAYYILFIFICPFVECFNPFLTNEEYNYTKEDVRGQFDDTLLWNQGDIPLLNRKVFKAMRVTIREHPYVASIRRHLMHYSVATILTKNMFITVAHPLVDVPIDELSVVVGENYADRGATLLTVVLLVIHEEFDPYTLYADLALIRVYEDTPYRCSVKSIQLVHPKLPLGGLRAFVTGWGRCDRTGRELCLPRSSKYTPGEKFDPMLRTASFVIKMPNFYCKDYKQNAVNILPGMLCTGPSRSEEKTASCLAVPGAPLVVNGHLAAILSWGHGCGYISDLPLIYTSVQYYQPWLLHNIPRLRHVSQDNLKLLFEAKRAYILSKWLNMTRIIRPPPFILSDKPMEITKLDRELAKLKGYVYDIRDYLYDGVFHNYKRKLYDRLHQKMMEKEKIAKIFDDNPRPPPNPFLENNEALNAIHSQQLKHKFAFVDVLSTTESDSYAYYN